MNKPPDDSYWNNLEDAAKGTFWEHIGARLESHSQSSVQVALDIAPHHLNGMGILHGGVHASLIDSAMGLLAMLAQPQTRVVTTNLNIHYLAPVREGAVTVTAELLHSSRKMITTQASIKDAAGQLCAWGTGTFRIVGAAQN